LTFVVAAVRTFGFRLRSIFERRFGLGCELLLLDVPLKGFHESGFE